MLVIWPTGLLAAGWDACGLQNGVKHGFSYLTYYLSEETRGYLQPRYNLLQKRWPIVLTRSICCHTLLGDNLHENIARITEHSFSSAPQRSREHARSR